MIKEKNGFLYSTHEFTNYKFRAKFVAEDILGSQLINMDVYTTNTDRDEVEKLLLNSLFKKHPHPHINKEFTKIVLWVSKTQDELTSEFIQDFYKDDGEDS